MYYRNDDSGLGGLEALLPDPKAVATRAQDLAKEVTSDGFKEKAFAYMYTQARGIADRAMADPKIRAVTDQITEAGNTIYDGGKAIGNLAKNVSANGKVDASGVVDSIQLAGAFTKGLLIFAQKVGLDSGTANEIRDWTGLAIGCATSIGAAAVAGFGWGGLVAAIGCAFSVMLKVLTMTRWQDRDPQLGPTEPRVILRALTGQAGQIQADVARLASVLFHHYGITTFATLRERITLLPWEQGQYYPSASYPFDTAAITEAVPGVSGTALLLAMHDPRVAYFAKDAPDKDYPGGIPWSLSNLNGCLNAIAWVASGKQEAVDYAKLYSQFPAPWLNNQTWPVGASSVGEQLHPCDLSWKYKNREDVNVVAISHGAALGRGILARSGATSYGGRGSSVLECPYSFEKGAASLIVCNSLSADCNGTWYFDFSPFIRVEELINYFVAITIRERETLTAGTITPWDVYLGRLPIGTRNAEYKGADGQTKGYDPKCWTGLDKGGVSYCDNPGGGSDLRTAVSTGNLNDPKTYAAIKEFAYIRLLTAFSQLLNWWNWSDKGPGGRVDPIKDIAEAHRANPIDTAIESLRRPVDPRQIIYAAGDPQSTWRFNSYLELREDKGSQEFAFDAPFKVLEDCARSPLAWSVHQTYCPWVMRGVPTGMWQLKAEPIRDGRRLAGIIARDEVELGWLVEKAQEQAAEDAHRAYIQGILNNYEFKGGVITKGYTYADVAAKKQLITGLLVGGGAYLLYKHFTKGK